MKKICFVFLLISVVGFAQNNHLNLQFNGGTSGFQLIDKGGTLIDIYNELIQEQQNGFFYNAVFGYSHNFGRFSVGANLSMNRLQEKSSNKCDSMYVDMNYEYVGLTAHDDYRYRFLNASAQVQFSVISHDKFSFGPSVQFGVSHIFTTRHLCDFDFQAVYEDHHSDQVIDIGDRPFIMTAGAGLFAQYKITDSWSLRADLNYTTFLQHLVKLSFPEKSWYRYYAASGGLGVVYTF